MMIFSLSLLRHTHLLCTSYLLFFLPSSLHFVAFSLLFTDISHLPAYFNYGFFSSSLSMTFIAYRLTAFPHFYCFVSHKSFNFIEAIVWKSDLYSILALSFSFLFFSFFKRRAHILHIFRMFMCFYL